MKKISLSLLALLLCAFAVAAQKVPVQEVVLDNGMRLLLVPRKGDPNVAAGWVARVGSVNERPGITGLSHLFEHMMFKGTHAIGTKDIAANLQLIKEMDQVRAELRKEQQSLILKARLGEITDAKDPRYRSDRHKELLAKFDELTKKEKELMVKDEFDRVYTTAGRLRYERRHKQRFHGLFHKRAGQQAGALVLDGIGPPPQSGLPRVLFRAGRSSRGTTPAHRQYPDRKI